MNRLKSFISNYEFLNEDEEILFFKTIKPKFSSLLLFYSYIYELEMNKVVGDIESKIDYYKMVLVEYQKRLNKNLEFVKYYRSNSTFLDRVFFIRKNECGIYYKYTSRFDRDSNFSTIGDYKVAQLLAIDMIQNFVDKAIFQMKEGKDDICDKLPITKITWTGKKFELIELIYALNEIKCFDSGNISLNQLVKYFEQVFNIDLRNYSRDFTEMKIRNTKAPFLDKLKGSILIKMNRIDNKFTSKKTSFISQ
jgi:RteC protein.